MANGELVLLYNLKGEKAQKLKMIFAQNRVRMRTVDPLEYGKSIGQLTGILKEDEKTENKEVSESDIFREEMLVMKGIFGKRLDLLLAAMRKAGTTVSLKAVVTESNLYWNSVQLYQEIRKEQELMTEGNPMEEEKEEQ